MSNDVKSKGMDFLESEKSKTRTFEGAPRIIINCILIFFSLLCFYIPFYSLFDTRINRAAFVGLLVACIYLLYPASKKIKKRTNHIAVYDIILAVLSVVVYGYIVFNCNYIIKVDTRLNDTMIIIGIIGIILTLEACRRATGLPIVLVAIGFIGYALMNQNLKLVIYTLFYGTQGILGIPINACISFISLFVIFGAFLERTGISDFFIDFANSLSGHTTGGPAKVAVISSALCGMVSGSSVGNTVTTGSITIPLMKKNGYKPEFAGAVEAAASTGGQIMPPIMGAAAFLMIEYTDQKYSFIALRAILPAVLYFVGIFISVHLEAKKLGLKGIPKSELPKFSKVLKAWYLILPLVVLTYYIITSTMTKAAAMAILVAIILYIAQKLYNKIMFFIIPLIPLTLLFIPQETFLLNHFIIIALIILTFFISLFIDTNSVSATKQKNEDIKEKTKVFTKSLPNLLSNSLVAGAESVIAVGIACAVAGVVAGVITSTGVAGLLSSAIKTVSSGNLIIAMFFTMITCIILGMGIPTTATYVIMATTCAPILIEMGMEKFAAHMFVFYFGIVADITPPVALAAYAGAAIADAKAMKTAINATLIAFAGFIVPYIFGLDPALLFINTNAFEVVLIIITSLAGILCMSSGIRGYLLTHLNVFERILALICGLLLIRPGLITDLIGLGGMAIIIILQIIKTKNIQTTV